MNTLFEVSPDKETLIRDFLKKKTYSRIFVLTDRNTRRHCWPLIQDVFPKGTLVLSLPPGEAHKNLVSCERVWTWLTRNNADRNALLVGVGGGVIGDLAGFCSSVYKRGIPFLQIPTSLLAMADACVGGKTGVDFLLFKNHLGTFYAPQTALVWPGFLLTLPEKELLSGFAELIKHTLIADAAGWHSLRKREMNNQDWPALIHAALSVKARITGNDPYDRGERQKLNAGHTLGHALESFLLQSNKPMPHGHCVAAGLIMEGRIALENGLLSEKELLESEELIFSLFGKIEVRKRDCSAIIRNCMQDKKNQGGKVKMALIGPIGHCSTGVEVSKEELKMALEYYLGN